MRQVKPNAQVSVLPSGLKVATEKWVGAPVEYCGVVVFAGSRYDGKAHPGLAHFVEHTLFKGTDKRSPWHILNRMERVGGELNAYTTKEETVVYTAAPSGNLSRSMELIADLVTSSRFPQRELDKEREVVADEINGYLDVPSEAVYDDFEDIIFAGTPLGHNILGTEQALATFDSDVCREHVRAWYAADNMSVFYCGPRSHERVVAEVEKCFAGLNPHSRTKDFAKVSKEGAPARFERKRNIGIHQAHTVMGCRIDGMYSSDRYAITLLNNILGGPGMNSLFNVSLREKRGLVYSVESTTSFFSDCGLFTVYFGCDSKDTRQCMDLIEGQIGHIAAESLSDKELRAAKKQYIGQLAVASDTRDSAAIAIGRASLYHGRIMSHKDICERIISVTRDDIAHAASGISALSSLTFM